MILRPVPSDRLLRLLVDYARNRSTEATLEDLLAYLYHRGLRVSASTLERRLRRLAEQSLVAIAYRQHYLLLQHNGRKWFLPVRRRIYILKLSRLMEALKQ